MPELLLRSMVSMDAARDFFYSDIRTPLCLSAFTCLTSPAYFMLLDALGALPVCSDAAMFSFLTTLLHLLFYLGVNGTTYLLPSLGIGSDHQIPRSHVCIINIFLTFFVSS